MLNPSPQTNYIYVGTVCPYLLLNLSYESTNYLKPVLSWLATPYSLWFAASIYAPHPIIPSHKTDLYVITLHIVLQVNDPIPLHFNVCIISIARPLVARGETTPNASKFKQT